MYFVNPKFVDSVLYARKKYVLKEASQEDLKELFEKGNTQIISFKGKEKKSDEKPPQEKPKRQRRQAQ